MTEDGCKWVRVTLVLNETPNDVWRLKLCRLGQMVPGGRSNWVKAKLKKAHLLTTFLQTF